MAVYSIGVLKTPNAVQLGKDTFHSSFQAILSQRMDRRRREKLLRVIFFLNEKEFPEPVDEMVASTEITFPAPGLYIAGAEIEVEVEVSGEKKIERVGRITRTITALEEEEKSPEEQARDRARVRSETRKHNAENLPTPQKLGEPAISFPGRRGRYRLNVFVPNEDGQPVSGVPVNVTISVPGEHEYPLEFLTDAFGRVNEYIPIAIEHTAVNVRVQGNEKKFDYLETLPPPLMTIDQQWGLGIGLGLIGAVILVGFWLSTMAP